jgi:hypothetical protein
MAVMLALFGCSASAVEPVSTPPAPGSAAPDSSRLGLTRATVDALVKTARAGDRASFYRLVSDQDPAFHDRARLLYDNLSTLPLTRLQIRLEPTEFALTDARQKVLGPGAWAQRGVVTWRLPGDGTEVDHLIWLTFLAADGEVKLAGTNDQPSGNNGNNGNEQQPSWWLGPLSARERGGVTVLAGSGQSLDRWTNLAAAALGNVREQLPAGLGIPWNGSVVIEVPATQRDFESVLGKPAGNYTSIAAVTHHAGAGGAAIRIVANPKAAQLTSGALQSVLEHEMVHVATRSPDSPAPIWAEEGLAEWVALRAHPGQRSEGTDEVLIRVRSDGPPSAFPSDGQFRAGARKLHLAYAEAWLTCRFIADRYSEAQLARFYAQLDDGRTLDDASRAALGLSGSALTTQWREYLDQLARY